MNYNSFQIKAFQNLITESSITGLIAEKELFCKEKSGALGNRYAEMHFSFKKTLIQFYITFHK